MSLISIIVPVYNVENCICRCIDSILEQTYKTFELILINDGSTDNSGKICDVYAKNDDRIIVIHQENKGVSAARNKGLENIKGQYVTFIDSDDYVYPEYLEYLYNVLIESNAEISICKIKEFSQEPLPLKKTTKRYVCYRGIQLCDRICNYQMASELVAVWGKLYRSHMFGELRFVEGKIHEDQFIMHKLLYKCKKAVILEQTLYGYYINQNGITKSGFTIKRYDNVEALEENEEFYMQQGETKLAYKAKKLSKLICAMYSIYAREKGIYKNVPRKYHVPILWGGKIIRKELGYEVYEWHMAKIMPRIIKIQSYIRKILSIANLK